MTQIRCLGCSQITAAHRSGRCPACRRALSRSKQARKAVLYDGQHKRERAEWVPLVASGEVPCARCGLPIEGPFDLDHVNGVRAPSHSSCNRSAK